MHANVEGWHLYTALLGGYPWLTANGLGRRLWFASVVGNRVGVIPGAVWQQRARPDHVADAFAPAPLAVC